MSDQSTNGGSRPDAGPQNPVVRIVAHYVRDLSFENVAAQDGGQIEGRPEITVQVNLDAAAVAETRYQVAMSINATAKSGESTRFIVELDYVGVFDIENVDPDHVHPFIFVECPRQILPYARRVISDVTRDGGYPPLMLDNVDFAALYRQKVEEMQANGGAPADA